MIAEERALPPILMAREIAGGVMDALGRVEDAMVIRSGGGDDFTEVVVALAAITSTQDRLDRLDRAVRYYADPDLWDEGDAGFSLAYYDQGVIARTTLAGRDALTEWD